MRRYRGIRFAEDNAVLVKKAQDYIDNGFVACFKKLNELAKLRNAINDIENDIKEGLKNFSKADAMLEQIKK